MRSPPRGKSRIRAWLPRPTGARDVRQDSRLSHPCRPWDRDRRHSHPLRRPAWERRQLCPAAPVRRRRRGTQWENPWSRPHLSTARSGPLSRAAPLRRCFSLYHMKMCLAMESSYDYDTDVMDRCVHADESGATSGFARAAEAGDHMTRTIDTSHTAYELGPSLQGDGR